MKRKEWRCRRSQRVYKVQVFKKIIIFFFFFTFWSCSAACGISVHQSGIEPVSAAVKVWNLNYWTAREVLQSTFMQGEGQTSRFKT